MVSSLKFPSALINTSDSLEASSPVVTISIKLPFLSLLEKTTGWNVKIVWRPSLEVKQFNESMINGLFSMIINMVIALLFWNLTLEISIFLSLFVLFLKN